MATFAEMSKRFAEASKDLPIEDDPNKPEAIEGGETKVPTQPAVPTDETQTTPEDGAVIVAEPKPKTPQEMAADPKPLLADEIDQALVDEMGAAEQRDIPDGNADARNVSTSMNDMSERIKNAGVGDIKKKD